MSDVQFTITIQKLEVDVVETPLTNTHTPEIRYVHTRVRAYVSFRRLHGVKPSSCKSASRQTATPAGLRIVNSSLCPGYWAHYCIIKKTHTHTHTLTKGYTLTGCVWALIRAAKRPWFICAISRRPESPTNNNQHHHHQVQTSIWAIHYSLLVV